MNNAILNNRIPSTRLAFEYGDGWPKDLRNRQDMKCPFKGLRNDVERFIEKAFRSGLSSMVLSQQDNYISITCSIGAELDYTKIFNKLISVDVNEGCLTPLSTIKIDFNRSESRED